jgi:hypothetical protein
MSAARFHYENFVRPHWRPGQTFGQNGNSGRNKQAAADFQAGFAHARSHFSTGLVI